MAQPFIRFLHIEAAGGAVLLSNSPWADAFLGLWDTRLGLHLGQVELDRSLRDWINNGLMTLFFFLVALELKREIILGEMRNPRMSALSVGGAIGGMIAPAAIYLSMQLGLSDQHGWGIVIATGTAFVVACLTLLGSRVPHSLRVFMLFLAIVEDIGGMLVVAIGYSQLFITETYA